MKKTSSSHSLGRANFAACFLVAAMAWGSAANGADAPSNTDITGNCSECHGTDGLGFKPGIPHINGQPEGFLTNMINAFQQGQRPTKVKTHREIAAADIAPLVKHYAQQKAERPKSATNPEWVVRGEALYLKRCADCHIDNGRESDKDAPLVAGQDLNYLVAQTLAFKTGERKFPYLMDSAYRDLSDDDLTATAHFFAAQEQTVVKKRRRR